MLTRQTYFRVLQPALSIVTAGCLYYSLYTRYQTIERCNALLGQEQLTVAQEARTEAQLNASESALDAIEAQLDKSKR